jgi:hypothetical protein
MKKNHRLPWQPRLSALENAKLSLPPLAEEFFGAGRHAATADLDAEELHQFRLAAKRFRYTLELFEPCYGTAMERRLKKLKALQDFLGDINDCVSAQALVENSSAATAEKRKAGKFLDQRLRDKIEGFQQHWINVFDAEGEEKRWVAFLAGRPAARKSAGAPKSRKKH